MRLTHRTAPDDSGTALRHIRHMPCSAWPWQRLFCMVPKLASPRMLDWLPHSNGVGGHAHGPPRSRPICRLYQGVSAQPGDQGSRTHQGDKILGEEGRDTGLGFWGWGIGFMI